MELSIYDIIRRPRTTTKAYDLNQKLHQLVLEVHPAANKPMIAEALEKLFNVKVEGIRIVRRKGKMRRSGRRPPVVGKGLKKAIVTLAEGEAVNLGVDSPAAYAAGAGNSRSSLE